MGFPFSHVRELAADVAGDLLGLEVRVVRGSSVPPKTGQGVWQPDLIEDNPAGRNFNKSAGRNFNKQGPRHVMALRVRDFETIPRGSIVEAQPKSGGVVIEWEVDGHEKQTVDWHHVILVRKLG